MKTRTFAYKKQRKRRHNVKKEERHQLIIQLLEEENIQKQEELVTALQNRNIAVTQATVSRDIKELKLIKVPATGGGYRYSLPVESDEEMNEKLTKLIKNAFVSLDHMDKFVVLKTLPGNASAIANLIDKRFAEELFAILNDDDNILMITKTTQAREYLFQELQKYI